MTTLGLGMNLPNLTESPLGNINPRPVVTRGLQYFYSSGPDTTVPYGFNWVTGEIDAAMVGAVVAAGPQGYGIVLGPNAYLDTETLDDTAARTMFGMAQVAASHALQSSFDGNVTSTNGVQTGFRSAGPRFQGIWSDDDADNGIETIGVDFGAATPIVWWCMVLDPADGATGATRLYLPGLGETRRIAWNSGEDRVVSNRGIRIGAGRNLNPTYNTPSVHYRDGGANVAWTADEVLAEYAGGFAWFTEAKVI